MMKAFIIFLVAFFHLIDSNGQDRVAIVHVNVVNVARPNELSKDQTVIINAGKITRIGPSSKTKVPPGFKVLEGNGKYLIPGLWDMHVHLSYYGAEAFPLLISNGVTSVRDMGGDLLQVDEWRADIKAGKLNGPMIFSPDSVIDDLKSPKVREFLNDSTKSIEHIRSEKDTSFIKLKKSKQYYDPILTRSPRSLPLATKLHKVRVPLLTGTDFSKKEAGIIPGKDLHSELALLVKAGLTPGEALRAATINAARCMGVEKKVGAIEEGLIANLVLLDADPLKDIANTKKILKVILNGKVQ